MDDTSGDLVLAPRTWLLMLLSWGCTWLLVAAACVTVGRYAGARAAAEGALVSFGLAAVTGVGAAVVLSARVLVERRLRSAGTAWPPRSC
jgi:hypothetical protein